MEAYEVNDNQLPNMEYKKIKLGADFDKLQKINK